MTTKRTDPHRPGAIVPADYTYELSFWYGTAEVPEGYGMEDLAKLVDQYPRFRNVDHSCDVCGARFAYGGAFVHKPTGQTILVGCDCAAKYAMLIDFAGFDAVKEMGKRATAAALTMSRNKRMYNAFLAANPGLREALMQNHRISMDLDAKLMHFHTLSPAQIELAFRLHSQAFCPARPVDTNVPAPEGRQKIRGIVVSTKNVEGTFGVSTKMTIKVTTPTGTWLCWGTKPATVEGHNFNEGPLKGREIEFTATLKRGREAHFALFSRPTGAKVIGEQIEPEPRPGLAGECVRRMNAGLHQ